MKARQLEVIYSDGPNVPGYKRSDALRTPTQVAAILRPLLERRTTEALIVLHLDARHRLIGYETAAQGNSNVVHVQPRTIFRSALTADATAIVVAHNHPSGDPSPSPDDADLTARLKAAGELVGVPLLDHLVVGVEGWYSFSSQRLTAWPATSEEVTP
jgi:DNA repair protein RadC